MKRSVIVLVFLLSNFAFAQTPQLDSLKKALKNAANDTIRCNILCMLVETEPDGAIWPKYNGELGAICEANLSKYKKGHPLYNFYRKNLSVFYNNIGYSSQEKGDIPKALNYYAMALRIQEEIGEKKALSISLVNIGYIYKYQGDIQKALKYYGRSLKIAEELDEKQSIASALNNIGTIYYVQNDLKKALETFEKCLKIRFEIDNKEGIAESLANIGGVYLRLMNYEMAMDYFTKAVNTWEVTGNKKGMATSLSNIALIFVHEKNNKKALEYSKKALSLQEEIGDKKGISLSSANIGSIYCNLKDYPKAISCGIKALQLAKELGYPETIAVAANKLSEFYKYSGNYKLSLECFELYSRMHDSIINENSRKASIKNQLKYEYEKKAAADSVAYSKEAEIKNIELQKQSAELSAKKNQQYAMYGGMALVIVFAGFMYNRFKITQRQKLIIEEKEKETQHQNKIISRQKQEVEEKQKEILDSIHYARRIQSALMASEKYIHKTISKLDKKDPAG